MENSLEIPLKTKNRTTIWSGNSTLGYISGKDENSNSKTCMHPSVYSSTIYNSQGMKTTQVPINNQPKKMRCVCIYTHTHTHTHTHTQWNISHKNKTLSFSIAWVDWENIILRAVKQRKINIVWYQRWIFIQNRNRKQAWLRKWEGEERGID